MSNAAQLLAERVDPSALKTILEGALAMREVSYSPYSHFKVGAALLAEDGRVYKGCNIENAGFTATNCAERTAFFTAVADGNRRFTAIAIAGGKEDVPETHCPPCGVCRQVMMEFCDPATFLIITVRTPEDYRVHTLAEYMPDGFGPTDLA